MSLKLMVTLIASQFSKKGFHIFAIFFHNFFISHKHTRRFFSYKTKLLHRHLKIFFFQKIAVWERALCWEKRAPGFTPGLVPKLGETKPGCKIHAILANACKLYCSSMEPSYLKLTQGGSTHLKKVGADSKEISFLIYKCNYSFTIQYFLCIY